MNFVELCAIAANIADLQKGGAKRANVRKAGRPKQVERSTSSVHAEKGAEGGEGESGDRLVSAVAMVAGMAEQMLKGFEAL